MKQCTVKKLFNGHVSVRSHIIKKCLETKNDLTIKHNGGKMVVKLKDLENAFQFHRHTFQSKYDPSLQYELVDFPWKTK